MKQVYTFHETVRGHLHILKEIPCEDYSGSYSSENGSYHIAIIADGHGAKECFRSSFGSKAVTEIAMGCLKEFAELTLVSAETEEKFYLDIFSSPKYRQMTIRLLTDTIIARWHDRVYDDYETNPPSEEEMNGNAEKYADSSKIPHIYGTTLIAALLLPKCLIVLHQGDGRCEVFYDDGTVDQPVPWDDRCEDTTTTSMCDLDVSTSIRNCVINLIERNVVACYLGSDGVEDAYRDTYEGIGGTHSLMGGVHTFYKDLTCQIASMNTTEFEEYLCKMLPEFSEIGRFSRVGSGDDISVAGIVDVEEISKLVKQYQLDVKKYALEEDLFWKEDELRGKMRKHGILQKRLNEAQNELDKKKEEQEQLKLQLEKLEQEHICVNQQMSVAKKELDEYKQDVQNAKGAFGDLRKIATELQYFLESVALGCNVREEEYRGLFSKSVRLGEQIRNLNKKSKDVEEELLALENNLLEAKNIFEEYDQKYQAIDQARLRIVSDIAELDMDSE